MNRFTFSVPESEVENWKEHVESSEYASVAELIRHSVANHIDADSDGADAEKARERHNEMMDQIEHLISEVDNNNGLLDLLLKRQLVEDDIAEVLELYLEEQENEESPEADNE